MRKGSRKFKRKEIADAISQSCGVVETVARRLGCDRSTVKRYLQDKEFKKLMEEARESFKDLAENRLATAVNNGNLTAIIFTLKTLAKDRGYIEKPENQITFDNPIIMTEEQAASIYRK